MTDKVNNNGEAEICENATPLLHESSKFSWHRVWLIFRYWLPRMRTQLWWYLVATILLGVIGGCIDRYLEGFIGAQFVSIVFYFTIAGPSVFGMKKGREFDLSLPAKNSEKMTFYLIMSMVVFPLIYGLGSGIYYGIMGTSFKTKALSFFIDYGLPGSIVQNVSKYSWIYNVISVEELCVLSLFCALFIRKNAVLKSIIITLFAFWIPSFGMGLIAGVKAVKMGYEYARANIDIMQGQTEVIKEILGDMWYMLGAFTLLSLIVFIIFLTLFIKKFPRRQM